MNNVTAIGGTFPFLDVTDPASSILSDFDGVASVGGNFSVQATDYSAMTAFQNLTDLGGFMFIANNQSITGLPDFELNAGPPSANDVGPGLQIYNNPLLATCTSNYVCGYLNSYENFTIANNAPGCNSAVEVTAACKAFGVADFNRELFVYPNPTKDFLVIPNLKTPAEKNFYKRYFRQDLSTLKKHQAKKLTFAIYREGFIFSVSRPSREHQS